MKLKHIAGCPTLFGVVLPNDAGLVNIVPVLPRDGGALDCRDRMSGRWMLLFSHECTIPEKYVRFETEIEVLWPSEPQGAPVCGPYVERPELAAWCQGMGAEVMRDLEERGDL